jgi:hypothetical protein
MNYELLIKNLPKTKKAIGTDKGLAKIGDSLVNLAYSIAKSIHLTQKSESHQSIRTGKKVSKKILANALKNANMKEFAKNRGDAHDLANTVEAIIAYVWILNNISIDDIIKLLITNLKGDLTHRFKEIESATVAFTELLLKVEPFLPERVL